MHTHTILDKAHVQKHADENLGDVPAFEPWTWEMGPFQRGTEQAQYFILTSEPRAAAAHFKNINRRRLTSDRTCLTSKASLGDIVEGRDQSKPNVLAVHPMQSAQRQPKKPPRNTPKTPPAASRRSKIILKCCLGREEPKKTKFLGCAPQSKAPKGTQKASQNLFAGASGRPKSLQKHRREMSWKWTTWKS